MSFPTITIKGNNPVKKKAVEAFLDLCLANDELTQHEVLDMLMKKYNDNAQFEQDALKYAALHGKYIAGTEYESLDEFIKGTADRYGDLYSIRLNEIKALQGVRAKLELKEGDDLCEAIENMLTSQRHPPIRPVNSDILADLREFKDDEECKKLVEMLGEIDMGEDPEPKEVIALLLKYKVISAYVRESKPDANDYEILRLVIESTHDEIIESKQV